MPNANASRIEHVVVLMLENRSFDHMLGAVPNVDGVDPNTPRSNRVSPSSPDSHAQAPAAVRQLRPDPRHETDNVLQQIDGAEGLGPMGGFVYDFARAFPRVAAAWPQVMAYFALGDLPALHALAQSYCVCDRWFSSVPGPTWTNRFFAHSGTSQGRVQMPRPPFDWNLHPYDQDTIYDRLNQAGRSWRVYYGDVPQSLLLRHQRQRQNLRRYSRMNDFAGDVARTPAAEFPCYVFIEPSYLPFEQNDQHPPHDVLKGDALIASVYNAIRGSKLWDSTLLIVTWDEHGGFYDHVVPPEATAPDAHAHEGFDFQRYGVRVPALLISKWIRRGSVFRSADGCLDHTSVLRFLAERFGLGPLGNRVASVASFDDALVDTPNDGPAFLEVAAPRALEAEPIEPYNDNQLALIELTKQLELESGATPAEIGARSLEARTGPLAEIEAAKARVASYLASA